MKKRKSTHPKSGDLYTIIGPEIIELFAHMRHRHESWRQVAYLSNTRLKVLRRWRNGSVPTISMTKLDELITTTGVGSLRDYVWYEADDLVAMGVWDKPAPPLNEQEATRARALPGDHAKRTNK
jgi:hypothetical protein